MSNFNARIKLKRDTAVNWTVNNPVLLNGEIILIDTDSGELRAKVGDGTKTYTQLPFTDEILRNLITNKQDKITGAQGQIVSIGEGGTPTTINNTLLDVGNTAISELPEGLTGPLTFIFDEDESGSDEIWDAINTKQDKLTGTAGQVVGFDSSGNAIAQTAPSGLPEGGTDGKILGYSASGPAWIDAPKTTTFVVQENAPSDTGVLWLNSTEHTLNYWDGSAWVKTVGVWG